MSVYACAGVYAGVCAGVCACVCVCVCVCVRVKVRVRVTHVVEGIVVTPHGHLGGPDYGGVPLGAHYIHVLTWQC